jgi:hypothetical protein
MNEARPYDPTFHGAGSVVAEGHCSQHGVDSCEDAPVISFLDGHGRRQSGCQRALDELVAREEISPPGGIRGGSL